MSPVSSSPLRSVSYPRPARPLKKPISDQRSGGDAVGGSGARTVVVAISGPASHLAAGEQVLTVVEQRHRLPLPLAVRRAVGRCEPVAAPGSDVQRLEHDRDAGHDLEVLWDDDGQVVW